MSGSLSSFPDTPTPFDALHLSQQAPLLLQKPSSTLGALHSLPHTSNETPETWTLYEKLFLSCLQTGDDKSAHLCLERLSARFEPSNERLMSLRGLYREAVGEDDAALTHILKDYEDVLTEDPANSPIAKRRITLLRSLSRPHDAISAILTLLDISPTDAEAWSELSDIYASLGLYSQAIYSLEEVLLIVPNAWNVQARMGELLYLSALSGSTEFTEATLMDAMRRFCRSIELCDGYLRGYYGLKIVTSRLLMQVSRTALGLGSDAVGVNSPSLQDKCRKLNELATSKLAEIITHVSSGDPAWQGYKESEVIVARQLLDSEFQLTKH